MLLCDQVDLRSRAEIATPSAKRPAMLQVRAPHEASNHSERPALVGARRHRATTAVALLFQLIATAAAAAAAPDGASSKPLWQRPGCYQVGHTRTISIPGCVKFNLSTNACRGYCMSFSIPAAEDIGPPASDSLDGLLEAADGLALAGSAPTSDFSADRMLLKRAGGGGGSSNGDAPGQKRRLAGGGGGLMALLEADSGSQQAREQRQFHEFQQLSSGLGAPAGEKRDVISVGQCCNMMETEDVTVNLRCGFNETRRLVFKSAKTCECFFCKHV